MHNIERIKKMKECLINAVDGEFAKGICNVDTKEAGDVVDMIKDLAEAEEKCMKACYYKKLIEAMDDWDGEIPEEFETMMEERIGGKRGYNPNRSSRTGRYMSNSSSNRSRSGMRGYPMDPQRIRDADERDYDHDGNPTMNSERFGRPYNEYRAMRRNYTESHSKEDKMAMEKHAKEHIDDAVSTMKDIWNTSDPELRKQMKSDLTNLLATMN